MQPERRKFQRYPIPGDKFLVFVRGTTRSASIKNMSLDGLQFEYFPAQGDSAQWTAIDIYGTDPHRFYLSDVPCNVIYDLQNIAEGRTFSGEECRISGLQFAKLTEAHKSRLESLLAGEIKSGK